MSSSEALAAGGFAAAAPRPSTLPSAATSAWGSGSRARIAALSRVAKPGQPAPSSDPAVCES